MTSKILCFTKKVNKSTDIKLNSRDTRQRGLNRKTGTIVKSNVMVDCVGCHGGLCFDLLFSGKLSEIIVGKLY